MSSFIVRDIWSSKRIKKIVKRIFFFSYNTNINQGQLNSILIITIYMIRNFLPHFSILVPIIGERVKQWDTHLPTKRRFLCELNKFLNKFSLNPAVFNPIGREPVPELYLFAMTEEEQLSITIRQSLNFGTNSHENLVVEVLNDSEDSTIELEKKKSTDPFDSINPIEYKEPENQPGMTTRIQICTGDGKKIH